MNRVAAQAGKLKQLLTNPKTYATYQTIAQTTWNIVVETGLLMWLVMCLSLVAFEWFWRVSVGAGRDFRSWFDNLQGSSDEIASQTSQAILAAGKNGLNFTISTAKSQLGSPKDS
jgi:hypothetical protein